LDFDRLLEELRAEQTSAEEIIGPADISAPTDGSLSLTDTARPLRSQSEPATVTLSDSPPEQTPERPERR